MGGYTAVDNGYARFDHVRIPRDQMLSAFASVTPEGEYIKPSHAKLSYGGVSCKATLSAFDSLMTSTDAVYSLWVCFVSALDTPHAHCEHRMVSQAGVTIAKGTHIGRRLLAVS